jgi:hypothetical protein
LQLWIWRTLKKDTQYISKCTHVIAHLFSQAYDLDPKVIEYYQQNYESTITE